MERPYILHMFTPGRQMSPFDINMAADAGYQVLATYCDVGADAIAGLVQDTIFSRSPKGLARTGIFIGGRDALVAADLLDRAKGVMFKPFQVSLMADPSGAYTTAAAMVACVEAALRPKHPQGLQGLRVLVVGGGGPVGRVAGVIAAQAGAQVHLGTRGDEAAAQKAARETGERFGVGLHGASLPDLPALQKAIAQADVLLGCAAAGVQAVPAEALKSAKRLLVAADLNAVPPEGIAGVGAKDDARPLAGIGSGAVGIGALAVGNVKYQTQQRLLQQMHEAPSALVLSFPDAFATARAYLAEKAAQAAG